MWVSTANFTQSALPTDVYVDYHADEKFTIDVDLFNSARNEYLMVDVNEILDSGIVEFETITENHDIDGRGESLFKLIMNDPDGKKESIEAYFSYKVEEVTPTTLAEIDNSYMKYNDTNGDVHYLKFDVEEFSITVISLNVRENLQVTVTGYAFNPHSTNSYLISEIDEKIAWIFATAFDVAITATTILEGVNISPFLINQENSNFSAYSTVFDVEIFSPPITLAVIGGGLAIYSAYKSAKGFVQLGMWIGETFIVNPDEAKARNELKKYEACLGEHYNHVKGNINALIAGDKLISIANGPALGRAGVSLDIVTNEQLKLTDKAYGAFRDNYVSQIKDMARTLCKRQEDPCRVCGRTGNTVPIIAGWGVNISIDEKWWNYSSNSGNSNFTPIIDPAGFVFEAVPSNRLEGVTATAFRKFTEIREDIYGDEYEVEVVEKWDASEYGQENPLITNRIGWYEWDVPIGYWSVTYEKDGYVTANSVDVFGWLPVPPPQMEVNVGMVSFAEPFVTQVNGYTDGIDITFSRYMTLPSLNPENIMVARNGKPVDGKIEFLNAEMDYNNVHEYASIIRFVPDAVFSMSDDVQLIISRDVESYAKVNMSGEFSQNVAIHLETTSISAQNISFVYGESGNITVKLNPAEAAEGKKINAISGNPLIASVPSEAVIDSTGTATIPVNGVLPGVAHIELELDGTTLRTEAIVTVSKTAPVYGIVLNPATSKDFGTEEIGYGEQAAHNVRISNSGNQPTGTLNIALSGRNADSFTLSRTSINNLGVGQVVNFVIAPKLGLTADTYTATVTVLGSNKITETFDVNFVVKGISQCNNNECGICETCISKTTTPSTTSTTSEGSGTPPTTTTTLDNSNTTTPTGSETTTPPNNDTTIAPTTGGTAPTTTTPITGGTAPQTTTTPATGGTAPQTTTTPATGATVTPPATTTTGGDSNGGNVWTNPTATTTTSISTSTEVATTTTARITTTSPMTTTTDRITTASPTTTTTTVQSVATTIAEATTALPEATTSLETTTTTTESETIATSTDITTTHSTVSSIEVETTAPITTTTLEITTTHVDITTNSLTIETTSLTIGTATSSSTGITSSNASETSSNITQPPVTATLQPITPSVTTKISSEIPVDSGEDLTDRHIDHSIIEDALYGNGSDSSIIIGENAPTIISADSLQAIREAGGHVTFELPSGVIITINPDEITDVAIDFDLNIEFVITINSQKTINGVSIPDNSIVILFNTHGEFGFEISVDIPQWKFIESGIEVDTVKFYYINGSGNVTEYRENLTNNGDGTVTIKMTHASGYVLTKEMSELTTSGFLDGNPFTAVVISFMGVATSGAFVLASGMAKKRNSRRKRRSEQGGLQKFEVRYYDGDFYIDPQD
jgi:hypothetical protein